MRNILTISLNPALDSAADVPQVLPDVKLRCENESLEPGGGGVNVSRAIKLLGGDSTAFVALGGATGNMMVELLAQDGVRLFHFNGPGLTRQNFAITESDTGHQYRFGQPGPDWAAAEAEAALAEIKRCLEPGMFVVASGSLPPGVAPDFYVKVGELVHAAKAKLIIDTSGEAQQALLKNGKGLIDILRMDRHESEILAGKPLGSIEEAAEFAQSLVKKNHADMVIVARGAEGSVFATKHQRFHCVAPKGKVVSKVGAGDSFVAGFTYGLASGLTEPEAGRLATAAAAAAVMTRGSQLCPKDVVDELLLGTETNIL